MVIGGGVNRGDTLLTAGPMVNMGSIGTSYVPWLLTGGTLVLHHPFDPQLLLKQLVEEKVNFTLLVPAVLNLILKHPATDSFDLSTISNITVGSAPPSLWSMQEFKRRWNIDIGNIWGQNEGTGIVSVVSDIPDMEVRVNHFPRYGNKSKQWAAPITEFIQSKIVDDEGAELTADGDVRELLYRGPNVLPGYYKRPDLNAYAF
ncbi:MAG: AMP-binding protein, partial [Desulfuromonadales bacterium]|nr:AMP-binding protein [Desulfuromonadales bacterium]